MSTIWRNWLQPPGPKITIITDPAQRRSIWWEILLVFAVTLGLSALRSLLALASALLRPTPLNQQSIALNAPRATLSLIDLGYQLLGIAQLLAWGGLGIYLLWRAGYKLVSLGIDFSQLKKDSLRGVGLAAAIGIPGLAFYLLSRAVGMNLNVLPSTLDADWWRIPILILSAIGNSWAEEILVVGYLITRLRQLGWSENKSLVFSAVLRGFYHLYQGFGGFIGNIIMGLVYGRVWQRSQRLNVLIIGHAVIDLVAFVGYALLRGQFSWLP